MGQHATDFLGANRKITMIRKFTFASFLALLIIICLSCARKTPTLNLLVWEGYADPSYLKAFEEANHCKISATYIGTSDELVAKLRGGSAGNYDVFSPTSDVATMVASSGLALPLDLAKLPSYAQLSPQLTSLSLVRLKGDVYGVPFMWGPDPILYDTTVFPKPPDSWAVLWDPKFKGKVSVWDDLATLYMAGQVLGYDKPDPGHLYNLSDAELDTVKKKLIELKPNIRKMWSTGGELTNLFQNHEVVIAMGWPLMTNQLRKSNFPVAETIPKEGTTGWIDHLMITAGSDNKELAYKFLEFMIQAQTQKQVSDVTGYTPANPHAAQSMTPDEQKNLHLDDVDSYQRQLNFYQNVPRRAKYNEIWNEVKATQ
jgi:putative spermidine/putrescine transport system substrate-binding protein/spermidine/putrescine transport system substrate-binding protein